MTSEERKEYNRQYYIKHRDKLLKKQRVYDEAHIEEIKKKRKEYYLKNKKTILEKRKLNKKNKGEN